MRLELAKESDSERLKDFFARMILPGAMDLAIRRHGSYFDPYRLISDDHETLMLVDDADSIQGVATLVFAEGVLNGERQTFGYATDLRIAPTRSAVLQWGQHFLPVLERALETRRCRFIFSALERTENQATNALIRPQQARRKLPRYFLLRRFHVVGIHGRIPFGKRPLSSLIVERLNTSTLSELCSWLRSRSADRPFARLNTEEDFLARLSRFPGTQIDDVRMARDSRGRILGCAAPFNPGSVQIFIPMRYHGFASTVYQLMRAASMLRLARPLSQPGRPLRLRFMTMLDAASPEAFHKLADDLLESLEDGEILAYNHFRGNLVTLPPKGYWVSALPYSLYTILRPEASLPDYLQPDIWRPPPDFDPTWI